MDGALWLFLHFVQANGRLQHEQDLKSLLADVGHHACNLRRFGYALVDRFAQLMNQFAEFLIQVETSIPRRKRRLPYLIF